MAIPFSFPSAGELTLGKGLEGPFEDEVILKIRSRLKCGECNIFVSCDIIGYNSNGQHMGVQQIIHFGLGFSIIYQPASFWGTPHSMDGNPHMLT